MFLRIMELLFFLYCFVHIFIAVLFDTQIVASDLGIPKEVYPEQVLEMSKQYVAQFKDPYFVNPPSWYKIFCFCEVVFQLPFCIIASYAFLRGSRAWIRVPTIIYSTHVITTLLPIMYSLLVDDFSKMHRVGPTTQDERLQLIALYSPYLIIPMLMLLTMICSCNYGCSQGNETKSASQQKTTASKKKAKKNQ
ncbi:sigma intracellular receptor 2-like [Watersipora subatra]|uniref:sigma intracellular receptor 2-like n=1 Tax=Watersipora subatra TaxID=2589382 RepID=UPI00355B78E5